MGHSKRVQFLTQDGVQLRGDYYAVQKDKAPLVIMTAGVRLSPHHKSFYLVQANRITAHAFKRALHT